MHETVGDDHERHRFVIWKWLSIDRYADEDENGRLTEPNYRVRLRATHEMSWLTAMKDVSDSRKSFCLLLQPAN